VRQRIEAVFDSGLRVTRVYETSQSALGEGERAGVAIASLAVPPTVVICQSDVLAAGVIAGLEREGLRVPADVSVTGFDGLDLPLIAPRRLTTVFQDGPEKGRRAAGQLLRKIVGEAAEPDDMTLTLREGTTLSTPRGSRGTGGAP
jgi:DNA-binding LacI/PurR family transcriptional regulator